MTNLQCHELEPGVREQDVRLVEVGDGLAQLTTTYVDSTPIHEHTCQIDRRAPLAEARDRLGEHLERLVDASRPGVQRSALEAAGLPLRFRAEPFDIVEMRERGRHRRTEGEHSGERQMGVGLGLGVADLLGGGDRRVQGRPGQVDLAEQASGPPEDGQSSADPELVAVRSALVDEQASPRPQRSPDRARATLRARRTRRTGPLRSWVRRCPDVTTCRHDAGTIGGCSRYGHPPWKPRSPTSPPFGRHDGDRWRWPRSSASSCAATWRRSVGTLGRDQPRGVADALVAQPLPGADARRRRLGRRLRGHRHAAPVRRLRRSAT